MDDRDQQSKKNNTHKGIFLLPNLFTTAALFGGFYAIIAAMKGQFEIAAIAIFISMVLDGLDGRVARLTNTESDFGAEYDSLADMVSFGVAPGLVMYQWSLVYLVGDSMLHGKIGWLGAFIYTTCTALRLARFNTQVGIADSRYFQGLASPAAAAVLMGAVWVGETYGIAGQDVRYPALVLTIITGGLMISRFSYYSFKGLDLRKKVPFVAVLIIMLIFVFLSIEQAAVLFSIFFLYLLSGPIVSLFRWNRDRMQITPNSE
ncbi:MAG: CDP-diacylglycerol--serine O-phosphatidyltransferase [Urechidicola sp.]|jgi:CDP-diacylglycerol--serine O-phosphatidyltransferase